MSKLIISPCPTLTETDIMYDWPPYWWQDKEWCLEELKHHPECTLFRDIEKTCLEHDPDGVGSSFHCPRCNLLYALKKYHNHWWNI